MILMDESKAIFPTMIDRLAIKQHEAVIGLVNSGQQFDDCGFAGTVLAQQREDLSTLQHEGNVVYGKRVGKVLAEVPQLEQRNGRD